MLDCFTALDQFKFGPYHFRLEGGVDRPFFKGWPVDGLEEGVRTDVSDNTQPLVWFPHEQLWIKGDRVTDIE